MNKEMMKREAKSVDIVFYMLYTENKRLVENDERDTAAKFAKQICARSFIVRSGKDVQDPKMLLDEVKIYDDESRYGFIVIDVNTRDAVRLSINDVREVIEMMQKSDGSENSGQLAKRFLEEQGVQL